MIFENSDKMKFERKHQMCKLKQEIITYLFNFVGRKKQGQWWVYKGEFKYDGKEYNLECDAKLYRNL